MFSSGGVLTISQYIQCMHAATNLRYTTDYDAPLQFYFCMIIIIEFYEPFTNFTRQSRVHNIYPKFSLLPMNAIPC